MAADVVGRTRARFSVPVADHPPLQATQDRRRLVAAEVDPAALAHLLQQARSGGPRRAASACTTPVSRSCSSGPIASRSATMSTVVGASDCGMPGKLRRLRVLDHDRAARLLHLARPGRAVRARAGQDHRDQAARRRPRRPLAAAGRPTARGRPRLPSRSLDRAVGDRDVAVGRDDVRRRRARAARGRSRSAPATCCAAPGSPAGGSARCGSRCWAMTIGAGNRRAASRRSVESASMPPAEEPITTRCGMASSAMSPHGSGNSMFAHRPGNGSKAVRVSGTAGGPVSESVSPSGSECQLRARRRGGRRAGMVRAASACAAAGRWRRARRLQQGVASHGGSRRASSRYHAPDAVASGQGRNSMPARDIVVVGASAGGVEALMRLFKRCRPIFRRVSWCCTYRPMRTASCPTS